jgi:tetratricopeptide (TPR) repeat protein
VGGLACVRYFRELSRNRALFLVGDIGFAREADVREHASGGIGVESNFWLEVNFHAIGEYVAELGGRALHPPYRHAGLNVSAFILGSSSTDFCETALAYDDAIGQYGPDDFFITSRIIGTQYQEMSRGELLAFVRSTGWDSDHFLNCMPYLLDSLQEISWAGREDLRRGVEEAWDAYYPMGADAGDLAFGFGVLLYTIGDYAEALEYFQRSLELFGEDPKTTFNIALCLHRLKRMPEVVEWLDRTLQLDPNSEQAAAMRASVMEAGV